MVWLFRVLLVLVLLTYLVLPLGLAAADTSVDVTVTATPMVSAGILNFTIIYVSDTQLDFTWNYAPGYDRIMIRAKYSEYPHGIPDIHTTPTDGYLVYYGSGVTASDTSMDFSQNPGPLYVSAWGQKITNEWGINSSTGKEVSKGVLAIFLALLALGTTGLSFWKRNIVLSMGAMLSWTTLGVLLLTSPDTISLDTISEDWVQILAFLFITMAIGCALYYLSGIGKTKITVSNSKGQTWDMWGRPPKEATVTRAAAARARHRERLSSISGRRRR